VFDGPKQVHDEPYDCTWHLHRYQYVTAGKWGSGKELSKMVEAELIPKLEMRLLAL
jgi:hypothetical protein